MKQLAIYGAGGFGREVLMLIQQINAHSAQWDFAGFFDDGKEPGTLINGYKVLGGVDALNASDKELHLVLALGSPAVKNKVAQQILNPKIKYPVLKHPGVTLATEQYVKIGEGSIIAAGNIITTNIEIGRHVILNLACTIGHDTIIGDFASFMPGINISGEVMIEKGVYVGTGAKIINQVQIGENAVIGAGAVVSKSIPANCTAVGVPAKPIKFHNDTNE